MTMEAKQATLKDVDAQGKGSALFAVWDTEDLDGDISRKGLFGHGVQEVFMIAHHLWSSGNPPLAKGVIYERPEGAVYDFEMNTEIEAGRAWLSHFRFDLAKGHAPRQAWSYGFKVLPEGFTPRPGRKGRELHALPSGHPGVLVIEVSPVTAAAQPLSRTLAAKQARLPVSTQRYFAERHAALDDVLRAQAAVRHEEMQEQARRLHAAFQERENELQRTY
jgi:hypothetical protein